MDRLAPFKPSNGHARTKRAQVILAKGGMTLLMAGAGAEARAAEVYPAKPVRVLVGTPSLPANHLREWIALAKAKWNGVLTLARTPPAVIEIINRDVSAVTNTPEMKEKVSADVAEIAPPNSPVEFSALLAREIAMRQTLVRRSGIRIE